MADLSALEYLKSGYIEPLSDPLQNFYTTSTVEQCVWTATSTPTSSSLERLDEAASPLMAASPQFKSEVSRLPTSESAPVSLATVGLASIRKKTELSESPSSRVQRNSVKRHAVIDKNDTDSVDGELIARGRVVDRSDVVSLCTDSGIESVARSDCRHVVQKQSAVRAAGQNQTVTGRHRSHTRSASDCGVQTAASKTSAPGPLTRKLSVTYSEQG